MPNKTEGVSVLVHEVLATLPEPWGEDVTEDVFLAIEATPRWLQRYLALVAELTKAQVNIWIGKYTKSQTGLRKLREVKAKHSSLTTGYSKLGR